MVQPSIGGGCPALHLLETAAEIVGVFETHAVGDLLDQEVIPGEQALGYSNPRQGGVVRAGHAGDMFKGPAEYREIQAYLSGDQRRRKIGIMEMFPDVAECPGNPGPRTRIGLHQDPCSPSPGAVPPAWGARRQHGDPTVLLSCASSTGTLFFSVLCTCTGLARPQNIELGPSRIFPYLISRAGWSVKGLNHLSIPGV
jgi:hypothetical protein